MQRIELSKHHTLLPQWIVRCVYSDRSLKSPAHLSRPPNLFWEVLRVHLSRPLQKKKSRKLRIVKRFTISDVRDSIYPWPASIVFFMMRKCGNIFINLKLAFITKSKKGILKYLLKIKKNIKLLTQITTY